MQFAYETAIASAAVFAGACLLIWAAVALATELRAMWADRQASRRFAKRYPITARRIAQRARR